MALTFGKYRHVPLEEVPLAYLAWVLRECSCLDRWSRPAVELELDRRVEPAQAPLAPWESILAQWYREMAMTFHPDLAGNVEQMKATNLAPERLVELFRAREKESAA